MARVIRKTLVVKKRTDIIKTMAEAPAVAVEKTIEVSSEIIDGVKNNSPVTRFHAFWNQLGPGLTTGAADDDPSGIATYSQTGATYGNQLLWLAAFTFPLMAVVQEMCARLGMVTGRGLAANIRRHFPRWVLYLCTLLLVIANTFNIGADLGAMAKSSQLIFPDIHYGTFLLLFAIVGLGLQIFTTYKSFAQYLKYLALVLLAYILTAFVIPNFNWHEVLVSGFRPSLSLTKDQILLIVAILGTTISPYLFFWQTSQEVEEEVLAGQTTINQRRLLTTPAQIHHMRVDVWTGMFLSNLVMFFIIAVTAATLHAHGVTTIATAADAANALRPLAGEQAYLLFAIGIIGTGLLAIPVLTGSIAYAFAETFGWRSGLYRQLNQAYAFYGIIILSTVVGYGLNFIGLDPIKALIYSAVANGLVAPVILALILLLASNKKIMGDHVNGPWSKFFGWLITGLMAIAGVATVVTSLVH